MILELIFYHELIFNASYFRNSAKIYFAFRKTLIQIKFYHPYHKMNITALLILCTPIVFSISNNKIINLLITKNPQPILHYSFLTRQLALINLNCSTETILFHDYLFQNVFPDFYHLSITPVYHPHIILCFIFTYVIHTCIKKS